MRKSEERPKRQSRQLGKSQSYELVKKAWIERYPDATPAEYERAMTRIARRVGL